MIKVRYQARFANRLFQYCYGRILAQRLDQALEVDALPGFPSTAGHRFGWLERAAWRFARPLELDRGGLPPDVVMAMNPRHIYLRGYFLDYEYYRPYRTQISREWLPPSSGARTEGSHLTIHVRSGDIWAENRSDSPHPAYPALPFSYYQEIVEGRRWGGVTVVTEDARDPMVVKIARTYDARVQSASLLADFGFLRSSSNLVLSVSTFAWWAAWLSDAQSIFLPVRGFFDPRVRPDVRLLPRDDERYRFIEFAETESWTGSNAERRRLLES